jgi:hypothetical protein
MSASDFDEFDEAKARWEAAYARRDRLEAEWWLGEMKAAVARMDDEAIRRAVRDMELYAIAQTIEWRWVQ